MRFFLVVAGVGLALCLACVIGVWLLRPPDVSVERVSIAGPQGRLAGLLWKPSGAPRMGVLVCHGVMTNKEVMEGLAVELAHRGALALTFDYGGYGESERHDDTLTTMVADSAAALNSLLSRLDPRAPIAAMGHSMGATYAVELAADAPIGAVVALGNEPVAADVPPRNVLYAYGAYDVFHSLDEVLATARESARDPDLQPGQTHGRFGDGSARALEISPLTDHGVEPLDPVLIRKSIEWLNNAFRWAPSLDESPAVRATADAQLRFGAFLGLGVALLASFLLLLKGGRVPARVSNRLHLIGFAAACGLGTLFPVDVVPIWADLALAVLLFGSIAVALQATQGSLRDWAGVVFLLSGCLLLGVLAIGAGGAARIGALSSMPLAGAEIASLRPYEGLCMLRALAFHRYTTACVPSPGLGVLLAVELWRPGWLIGAVAGAVRSTLTALRIRGPVRIYGSKRSLVLAALVLVALVALLARRISEGWLDAGAAWRMGSIAARGLLLPLALFALVVNLVLKRREQRAQRNARGEAGGLA